MSAGLADTSVIIDWDDPTVVAALPAEVGVSTVTMAELAAGPHLARDSHERARRQARLQEAESLFEPIDFDRDAARSFGLVVSAMAAAGRKHHGRFADAMIAAVAHASQLEIYTRNPDDFSGLEGLVRVNGI